MFGEKIIAGYQIGTVDKKSRIIIPKFTNIEPNEELALIQEENEIYIISTNKLNEIYEKILKMPTKENLELLKDLRKECEKIIQIAKVDKQNRFTLGKNINFENSKIEFIGSADRLYIKGNYSLTKEKRCK